MQPQSPNTQKSGNASQSENRRNSTSSMEELDRALCDLDLDGPSTRPEVTLTPEQQLAYDKCLKGNKSVFCTGGAGCGKSVVLSSVVKAFTSVSKRGMLAVTAPTGAAALIIGGTTLHRFAGVGIIEDDLDAMLQRVTKGQAYLRWTQTDILIIDEISMVSPVFFENLSRLASILRKSEKVFGGMRILAFGDFLQLPPVSTTKCRGSDKRYIFQTATWMRMDFERVNLTSSVRHSLDMDFKAVLEKIRFGKVDDDVISYVQSLSRPIETDTFVEPVRLTATRRSAISHNQGKLDQIDSEEVVFHPIDRGDVRLLRQYFAEDQIVLKEGAQVMLTRNLNSTLVNGSTGTVVSIEHVDSQPMPIVRFVSPDPRAKDNVQTVMIQHATWEIMEGGRVVASRTQMPLMLAWAVTIHKSQGKTIPLVNIDAGGIFETGQLYVALSRCPRSECVRVENFDPSHIMADGVCVSYHLGINRKPVTRKVVRKILGGEATKVAKETDAA